MKAQKLVFYLDLISPFAYFAWPRVQALAASRGLALEPRPVLLAGLLNHWGQLGPAEIAPKRSMTYATCLRYAAEHGVAFTLPARHPFNPLTALRLCTHEVAGERQTDVLTALFELGWIRGGDLGDRQALADALEGIGLEAETMLAMCAEPRVKQALRQSTEEAIAAGVFGVPTFAVGDRMFWGNDQLRYVELYLDGDDPLDVERLADFNARDADVR